MRAGRGEHRAGRGEHRAGRGEHRSRRDHRIRALLGPVNRRRWLRYPVRRLHRGLPVALRVLPQPGHLVRPERAADECRRGARPGRPLPPVHRRGRRWADRLRWRAAAAAHVHPGHPDRREGTRPAHRARHVRLPRHPRRRRAAGRYRPRPARHQVVRPGHRPEGDRPRHRPDARVRAPARRPPAAGLGALRPRPRLDRRPGQPRRARRVCRVPRQTSNGSTCSRSMRSVPPSTPRSAWIIPAPR